MKKNLFDRLTFPQLFCVRDEDGVYEEGRKMFCSIVPEMITRAVEDHVQKVGEILLPRVQKK